VPEEVGSAGDKVPGALLVGRAEAEEQTEAAPLSEANELAELLAVTLAMAEVLPGAEGNADSEAGLEGVR
jgi:hypothetical protein